MTAGEELQERYRVIATRSAKDAGKKLLQERNRLWLIRELQKLKHWPDNSDEFEHEKFCGAIKLDFKLENKWIRVFVYQDDARKVMWVIRAFAKKTNSLTIAQRISVETAVSRIEQEIRLYKKQQKQQERRAPLRLVEGGRK